MSHISLFVPGKPPTQGSVRVHATGNGKVSVRPSDAALGVWRAQLRAEFERLGCTRLEGAVRVQIIVVLSRPKSHFRTGAKNWMLRDDAPTRPTAKPDVDKVLRAVLDALTYAGTWDDDAQAVDVRITKSYAEAAGLEAGVFIEAGN